MRALKYIVELIAEFFVFARRHKAWWIIPLILVLLMIGLLIIAGQSSAPFIYTLF